jgi:hypothetical protein
MFKSNLDLSNHKILSACDTSSSFTYKDGDIYMFNLQFLDNKCKNSNFDLVNEKNEIKSEFRLNLFNKYNALSKILDLDTVDLIRLKNILNKKKERYLKYSNYNKNLQSDYYDYLNKNRILKEVQFNEGFLNNIIKARESKYIVPVA